MNEEKQFLVPISLINRIVGYLVERPWKETNSLLVDIHNPDIVQSQEKPSDEEK